MRRMELFDMFVCLLISRGLLWVCGTSFWL